MKSYWIALDKKIESPKHVKEYATKVTPVIKRFGGKPLVRGGEYQCLEGENFPRTVIWEFPNYESAIACHDSKEYQDGWALASHTVERNLQIIKGFNIE